MNIYIKNAIYILIGILIGYVSFNNLPLFTIGKISDLEKENKILYSKIEERNNNIKILDSCSNTLKLNQLSLQKQIDSRSIYIKDLEIKIDSINKQIYTTDTVIKNLTKQKYEEINNINSWNTNQRISYFAEYFKAYNNQR